MFTGELYSVTFLPRETLHDSSQSDLTAHLSLSPLGIVS